MRHESTQRMRRLRHKGTSDTRRVKQKTRSGQEYLGHIIQQTSFQGLIRLPNERREQLDLRNFAWAIFKFRQAAFR